MFYIISTVEPIPIIDGNITPWRSQKLAEATVKKGIKTSFFISSFNHYNKRKRDKGLIIKYEKIFNLKLRFIPSISYKNNISILRLINYFFQTLYLCLFFLFKSKKEDIAFITVPALEHLLIIFFFRGKVIIDYRDLWPDIFNSRKKNSLSFFIKIYILLSKRLLKFAFGRAVRVYTISQGFQKHIIKNYKLNNNKSFVLTHSREISNNENNKNFSSQIINPFKFTYIYAGKITHRTNILPYCQNLLSNEKFKGKIIICGSGEKKVVDELINISNRDNRIKYFGFLNYEDLEAKYIEADIGIIPYQNEIDFSLALPNKFFEYLSKNLLISHQGLKSINNCNNAIDANICYDFSEKNNLISPQKSPKVVLSELNYNYYASLNDLVSSIHANKL